MRFILSYMKRSGFFIAITMAIKFAATFLELLIPYVLEHMIDDVAPLSSLPLVFLWGGVMVVLALLVRFLNKRANQRAVESARKNIWRMRQDLFEKTIRLSSDRVDEISLPSLISRLTSDSYNVQSFMQSSQTLGVRAPILLLGGLLVTFSMDRGLALILLILAPLVLLLITFISRKGIPLYSRVQKKLDEVVRVMRENISGIRVIKALGKEEKERDRFRHANRDMSSSEIKAGLVMSLPFPLVSLFMNIGLVLVVLIGADRVNRGVTSPGVILAFLSYFQMILMGVLTLNRVFMMMSKANASAERIKDTMDSVSSLETIDCPPEEDVAGRGYVVFDHVSFSYGEGGEVLKDISFSLEKGKTLGIIGATGSGKSTIINLMMRFYDPQKGRIYVDGRDVRSYELPALRKKFGAVFQNDFIFRSTVASNIRIGRDITEDDVRRSAREAMASSFIESYSDGYEHEAAIHGSSFSGGQKQRILISRALAGSSPVVILDDSSSALDYKTDRDVRRNIRSSSAFSSLVIIAQRVSSVMNSDEIIFLKDGRIEGKGTHSFLLEACPEYRDIYETQMGEAEE